MPTSERDGSTVDEGRSYRSVDSLRWLMNQWTSFPLSAFEIEHVEVVGHVVTEWEARSTEEEQEMPDETH